MGRVLKSVTYSSATPLHTHWVRRAIVNPGLSYPDLTVGDSEAEILVEDPLQTPRPTTRWKSLFLDSLSGARPFVREKKLIESWSEGLVPVSGPKWTHTSPLRPRTKVGSGRLRLRRELVLGVDLVHVCVQTLRDCTFSVQSSYGHFGLHRRSLLSMSRVLVVISVYTKGHESLTFRTVV